MCFPKRGPVKEGGSPVVPPAPPHPLPLPPSSRSEKSEASAGPQRNKSLFFCPPAPVETKPEQVQNRLEPVIKNLCDVEPLFKTGGSSNLLAEKLAQKNKLDETADPPEATCEDDANYAHLRKDLLKIVDKSHRQSDRADSDTQYEIKNAAKRKQVATTPEKKKPVEKSPRMAYKKDVRQSSSGDSKKNQKATEKLIPDYDTEAVNEKNFMYNLKEIDYCTHDMMRCIEEDNLYKNIYDDSKLPEKVNPFGDLDVLAKRRYTSCKVLRRNTLISTILSMPSADEKEQAATATAKHFTEGTCIKFLPPISIFQYSEDAHEGTAMDVSETKDLTGGMVSTGTGGAASLERTAIPEPFKPSGENEVAGSHSKKRKKKKEKEGMSESEKKTAEEM